MKALILFIALVMLAPEAMARHHHGGVGIYYGQPSYYGYYGYRSYPYYYGSYPRYYRHHSYRYYYPRTYYGYPYPYYGYPQSGVTLYFRF